MKKILTLLVLFVLTGCSSSDGDSDTEIVVSLPETFGVWTPSFTDQTSNFDQTRNGNQGTQQTRTITVTSSSNTSSSNEEIINEDINSDGDLFEEIEIIVITYTGSENLGSHEVTTYNILEDNDMGITVGNDFYPLSGGYLYDYGIFDEVENCNSIYNMDLYLYSDGIQFINNDLSGTGTVMYFELFMNQSNFKTGIYTDMLNVYNTSYNQNFQTTNDFDFWYCGIYDCNDSEDDGYEYNPCNQLDLKSTYNSFEINETQGGYIEGGDNNINFTEGELSVTENSDNIYTIKLSNGINIDQNNVKLFFKGSLGKRIISGRVPRRHK